MEDITKIQCVPTRIERTSLCLSGPVPGVAVHSHDHGFQDAVEKCFSSQESDALERLISLKKSLANAKTEDFWKELMEGITTITGSQYAFVAKRILVDDQDSAIEMPLIGDPGSCLMAVAFYYNDGDSKRAHFRDYKYVAYGAACAHMKHDKVFMIPEGLPEFVTNNPTEFAFPVDAYLGIPLFWDGKCFAHFGTMWSADGLKKRGLSWGYVEVLLHALEDTITKRLVERESFRRSNLDRREASVIPQDAVNAAQSLKPYARSLSHELRTPMQGVVGMLEIMHATVQESLESHPDEKVRDVFKALRNNIEIVQDSSQRVVEAADNVVQAYDLNMQVPETPDPSKHVANPYNQLSFPGSSVDQVRFRLNKGTKRRASQSTEWNHGSIMKYQGVGLESTPTRSVSPRTCTSLFNGSEDSAGNQQSSQIEDLESLDAARQNDRGATSNPTRRYTGILEDSSTTPGLRFTKIRELFHTVINESLRMGGRPDSTIAEDTEFGETIEVRSRSSNSDVNVKNVEWSVEKAVPHEIFVDERDLAKLISVVFLNAVKFTENGKIILSARLSPNSSCIIINVRDTGPGIPKAFMPYLFKPFAREDDSITRQNEGLGLGLLVAKGLARKIGGDLICLRSDTEGPHQGSEFEIQVPLALSNMANGHRIPRFTPIPLLVDSLSRTPTTESLADQDPWHNNISSKNGGNPTIGKYYKAASPRLTASPSRLGSFDHAHNLSTHRTSSKKAPTFDRNLAKKHPLNILVAEDNRINRKLLVSMLSKLGYTTVHEAFDGAEAVRLMTADFAERNTQGIDVILMDLWMPNMDGYEATERILEMQDQRLDGHDGEDEDNRWRDSSRPKILAVTADATEAAINRAKEVGMVGIMTKPYKMTDLEKLLVEHCITAG